MKALGEAFSHFEKQAAALSGERGCRASFAVKGHKCWAAGRRPARGLGEPHRKTSSPQFTNKGKNFSGELGDSPLKFFVPLNS